MELKDLILDKLIKINICKDLENLGDLLTYSPDVRNGDVTLPCFSLAKTLRKNPIVIADEIVSKFQDKLVERVENVNGYVNFYFNRIELFKSLICGLENFKVSNLGQGKTVFVDFSSLNLAKYMHIGHLSTTVIGSVIANAYEYLGWKVIRLNYVGDYGTPFGKMITAIIRWGDESEIEKKGVDYIQDLYVKFNVEAEKDESLMQEARDWFVRIENKDLEALRIYDKIIAISKIEAKRLCDALNISFDSWIGEAYYADKWQPVIEELEKKNLLVTSEGARIVDLEKFGLGACMMLKTDGTSLYTTRDIATAMDRYDKYHFDLGLYVTSVQQNLHFQRWFKVLELLGKEYAGNLKHVNYGTYSLPSGKIGSRFGKQALVKDMLDLSIAKARQIVSTRGTKVADIDKLAQEIGVGAIKFGVLKTERIKDCVFDLESSLNFDGETSPYIQYTYARCNSILAKSQGLYSINDLAEIDNEDAIELIKHLNNFEKTVLSSARDFEPCYISRYLLSLCGLFNKFYNNYRIIDGENVSGNRLRLVKVAKDILGIGLRLLGIDAPTAM